ncbi:hypothetical protein BLNAU_17915 [Blattamonas nauphoetae]|uniref:ZSWIM1/3 RNaseH-like domain-containing protein n=1 Tax=Blattamonas nauphoetae TaxID=2049346 RepID=A0ABQ9X741_9EUKA|nr:hypothetical protein BLNAU_17915 [Blattamonas nauphoetae]
MEWERPFPLQDIYQLQSAYRSTNDGGNTPLSLDELITRQGYYVDYRQEPDGKLSAIFISSPASIQLYQQFPTMIVMDATYNTNKNGYHLVQIAGKHSIGRYFVPG